MDHGEGHHRDPAGVQGRSKVVAAFGRKPLNFRITSGLEATLEQPWLEWRRDKLSWAKSAGRAML
jgi:hypothetical protein